MAERQRSDTARIYGYGVVSILFIHFAINIGMTLGLFTRYRYTATIYQLWGSSLLSFTLLLFHFHSSRRENRIDMTKYKHLMFDLDRTLWDMRTNHRIAFEELYTEFGFKSIFKCSFEEFLRCLPKNQPFSLARNIKNKISPKSFLMYTVSAWRLIIFPFPQRNDAIINLYLHKKLW